MKLLKKEKILYKTLIKNGVDEPIAKKLTRYQKSLFDKDFTLKRDMLENNREWILRQTVDEHTAMYKEGVSDMGTLYEEKYVFTLDGKKINIGKAEYIRQQNIQNGILVLRDENDNIIYTYLDRIDKNGVPHYKRIKDTSKNSDWYKTLRLKQYIKEILGVSNVKELKRFNQRNTLSNMVKSINEFRIMAEKSRPFAKFGEWWSKTMGKEVKFGKKTLTRQQMIMKSERIGSYIRWLRPITAIRQGITKLGRWAEGKISKIVSKTSWYKQFQIYKKNLLKMKDTVAKIIAREGIIPFISHNGVPWILGARIIPTSNGMCTCKIVFNPYTTKSSNFPHGKPTVYPRMSVFKAEKFIKEGMRGYAGEYYNRYISWGWGLNARWISRIGAAEKLAPLPVQTFTYLGLRLYRDVNTPIKQIKKLKEQGLSEYLGFNKVITYTRGVRKGVSENIGLLPKLARYSELGAIKTSTGLVDKLFGLKTQRFIMPFARTGLGSWNSSSRYNSEYNKYSKGYQGASGFDRFLEYNMFGHSTYIILDRKARRREKAGKRKFIAASRNNLAHKKAQQNKLRKYRSKIVKIF